MNTENPRIEEIKQIMNDLIQIATSYDIDELDRIYHDDMNILMIDTEGTVNTANKTDFIQIFQAKKDAGDPPMNTWADLHQIDVDGDKAHVLVSRKNDLSGQNMFLILSIDFIFQDNRWQITREVIFLRPED
jgi:ketosteroid isomerase-like protein